MHLVIFHTSGSKDNPYMNLKITTHFIIMQINKNTLFSLCK